jgi:hypothetical protein
MAKAPEAEAAEAPAEEKTPVDRKKMWEGEEGEARKKQLSETLKAKYASGELKAPMAGKSLSEETKHTIKVKALERALNDKISARDTFDGDRKSEEGQKAFAKLESDVEKSQKKLDEARAAGPAPAAA